MEFNNVPAFPAAQSSRPRPAPGPMAITIPNIYPLWNEFVIPQERPLWKCLETVMFQGGRLVTNNFQLGQLIIKFFYAGHRLPFNNSVRVTTEDLDHFVPRDLATEVFENLLRYTGPLRISEQQRATEILTAIKERGYEAIRPGIMETYAKVQGIYNAGHLSDQEFERINRLVAFLDLTVPLYRSEADWADFAARPVRWESNGGERYVVPVGQGSPYLRSLQRLLQTIGANSFTLPSDMEAPSSPLRLTRQDSPGIHSPSRARPGHDQNAFLSPLRAEFPSHRNEISRVGDRRGLSIRTRSASAAPTTSPPFARPGPLDRDLGSRNGSAFGMNARQYDPRAHVVVFSGPGGVSPVTGEFTPRRMARSTGSLPNRTYEERQRDLNGSSSTGSPFPRPQHSRLRSEDLRLFPTSSPIEVHLPPTSASGSPTVIRISTTPTRRDSLPRSPRDVLDYDDDRSMIVNAGNPRSHRRHRVLRR